MRTLAPAALVAAWLFSGCTCVPAQPREELEADAGPGRLRVLAFTRTEGYRHGSIPVARSVLIDLATKHGWSLLLTEDPADFTDATLGRFDVLIFLLTSGDVLDPPHEAAVESFVRGGRAFVGVHSAADSETGWPFFGELLGAWFHSHPLIQQATVKVETSGHRAAQGVPATWVRTDEWYNFKTNPRASSEVVLTLDESTYSGGSMGADHPIAWARESGLGSGRSFYTALGHTDETWADPIFVGHLEGGIFWAARR